MEMLSKSARQIEEAQKSRNCLNKQGVNFPSRNKQWRVAQAQNSTGRGFITDSRTIENQKKAASSSNFRKVLWWTLTRTDFSIMYSWFVIRYYSLLTTGRCYKAIVCCKAKMCSHEILKICMCLEVAFPWKPRTRQSFRETRFKNEIFWTISGLKRLVESFNVHLKILMSFHFCWCCCRCGLVVLENCATVNCMFNSNILRHYFAQASSTQRCSNLPFGRKIMEWDSVVLLKIPEWIACPQWE